MPYKDDIWDWSGTDVKVVNATVVLEGVSVVTAEPSENAIEPLERADVELLLPIQIISREETPTVSPLEIIDYGSSSIECAFDVTTQQAEEVVKGVLCGTTNPPTFENADYRLLHGQGSIDLAFAGLHPNTEYYLRPYALSNLGYKYGDVVAQRTKASLIPDEYQLVEYIESTGAQYIETNILYYYNNTCDIKQEITALSGDGYFGVNGQYQVSLGLIPQMTKVIVLQKQLSPNSPCYTYVNENLVQTRNDGSSYGTGGNYTLFKLGSYSAGWSFYRFHRGTFVVSGILLRGFYPVYRKADNKPGLYDLVNNQFYVNQGSGEFTVGPDKEWEE